MMAKVSRWWTRWGAWLLAILFVAAIFGLSVLKHDSFHTRAFDLGKFDQAIWNTLHGQFLYSSLQSGSILENHFSPILALLSPLFLIWNDIRMLFLIQAIGLAVAGLFLYHIVQSKYPKLAPWFLLAYFANPALHEIALIEFRRVTLAVPFLALALYALYHHKRKWLVVGLVFALLCKENVSLVVFMVGVYLIVFERDWKWGGAIALVGIVWAVAITLWVIPALAQGTSVSTDLYPQLGVFCLEGESYAEILANVLRDPLPLLRRLVDREALQALWRILFPVGLILPFLASDWLLIIVPSLAYMLLSCMTTMHRLEGWYMASVLPGLFAAIAVALTRLPGRKARWATAWLLFTAVVGYVWFSLLPPGARYEPALYQVNDHHRLAQQVVDTMPKDVRVAVQDPYVPHLTHREQIYLFPWISTGLKKIDYFLLDRKLHPYPLQPEEVSDLIDEMLSNPALVIEMEGDSIFLFHQGAEPLPAFPVERTADGTMLLERAEVAVLGADGLFHTVAREPIEVRPSQTVRVSLYWEALDAPLAERTVSVRILDGVGMIIAQSDSKPGGGKKPTSEWPAGAKIRDVHYLTISPGAQPSTGRLETMVYNSDTIEPVAFDNGEYSLRLADVVVVR